MIASLMAAKKESDFDPRQFLTTMGAGRRLVAIPQKQRIYGQGEACDAVFYIRAGKVRLTMVSENGREATLGILGEGEFFGEGSLSGQPSRTGSAIAMTDCNLMRIDKKAMVQGLREEHSLSAMFTAFLLARNIRSQEDLVDQLFNSSEKRLARVLLLLSRYGADGVVDAVVPRISQETLAEMIGTTRSRVSFFMNRFRESGYLDYGGNGMHVHGSMNAVLQGS